MPREQQAHNNEALIDCDVILSDDLPPTIAAMRDELMRDTAAFLEGIEQQNAELELRWYQLGLYYVRGEVKTLVH